MRETTITFRIDEDLKQRFTAAARLRDRSAAELLRAFMQDFVERPADDDEYATWFCDQVQLGLDAAQAGDLVAADAVEAEFAERRAQTRRKVHPGS